MTASQPQLAHNPLAFERYQKAALARHCIVPSIADIHNGLIAKTNHFFAMTGAGSFMPGYILILPQQTYTSFACAPSTLDQEADWLIRSLSNTLAERYGVEPVHFEHGKASVTGGIDHAHYHLMPLKKGISRERMIDGINHTLQERFARNPEKPICDAHGQPLHFDALEKPTPGIKPLVRARELVNNQQHYVFFKAPEQNITLLTPHHLGSQVCREFAVNAHDESMEWDWAREPYFENMRQTMRDLSKPLLDLQASGRGRGYGFQSYIIPRSMRDHTQPSGLAWGYDQKTVKKFVDLVKKNPAQANFRATP